MICSSSNHPSSRSDEEVLEEEEIGVEVPESEENSSSEISNSSTKSCNL
jgi:hypothetical protein